MSGTRIKFLQQKFDFFINKKVTNCYDKNQIIFLNAVFFFKFDASDFILVRGITTFIINKNRKNFIFRFAVHITMHGGLFF